MKNLWGVCALLLLSCAPDDTPRPATQGSTLVSDGGATEEAVVCVDEDGDGYGDGCSAGLDCDDSDRDVALECDPCRLHLPGCPCTRDATPVACDLGTNGPITRDTCWRGLRVCEGTLWGDCQRYAGRFE